LGEEEKAQAKGERSALLRQWGVYSPRFNSEADKKSLRGINPLVHVPQEVGIINFSVIFNSDGFNSDEKDPLHNFPHTMISRMCGGQINPNEGEFEGYPLQFTCPLRIPYIFISIDVCSDTMEDDGYEGYYMGVDFNTYEGIYVRDNGHYRLYGVRTQYFDGHRLKEQRQDFKPYWCFPSLLTEEEQILLKEVVYEDSDKRQLPENRLRHFGKI
jgi:hypothetical protein